ncbi:MAG: biopolymer transporter Tol, partial [Ignavibacteria bacterium]|nr:biopolymer transporter Tol [Ignavibacteria bacterium]
PLERKINFETLPPTRYITELKKNSTKDTTITQIKKESENILINYADSIQIRTGNIIDSTSSYSITSSGGFSNYIFNEKILSEEKKNRDSVFFIKDNRDTEGNFIINKYKITFSPDIIYANAGFSTFYGLLGTTVLAFSDLLGNHQLIGLTSLQIDLKNSDYGLAYYYLAKRIDYGIEGFHTARFLFLTQGGYEYFYRFRNYGVNFSMSYPIDKFYRIDGGIGWLNITKDNLDVISEESEKLSFIIPSISFVHDNSLWGFTSPIRGTRYNLTVFGVPSFSKDNFNFFSIQGDYRTYFRFFTDYSLTLRLSTGISTGRNPQKFMIGGTENWINRQFERNEIPIQSAADFLFLTPVLPLRGYNYAQMIGTRFGLFNLELHFPLIKMFQAGLLPIIFKNVQGVGFIDIGSAWNKEKEFRLAVKNENGSTVFRDLMMGTGLGARIYFLYFLLKFDVAWSYDLRGFSKAKFYFSLGTDL